MSPDEDRLQELARAVADGEEIDWAALEVETGESGLYEQVLTKRQITSSAAAPLEPVH